MNHQIKTVKISRCRLGLLMLMLGFVPATPHALAGDEGASFQGLGNPTDEQSEVSAVSGDGLVVVGRKGSAPDFRFGDNGRAFKWTSSDGFVDLGTLGGYSTAKGVSDDGSVVAGYGTSFRSSPGVEGWRWTEESGMVGLGSFGDDDPDPPAQARFHSQAFGVSGNGAVVVGESTDPSLENAFRWTEQDGFLNLGTLTGGGFSSATAISLDGRVIVGCTSDNDSPNLNAFRWTEDGGMVGLERLPGGSDVNNRASEATDVSDDGAVVVGEAGSSTGLHAFRWTEQGGTVALGEPSDEAFNSFATGVSGDGAIVVGGAFERSDDPSESNAPIAVIWTANGGAQSLQELLENEFGLDLTGWHLEQANGISTDGRTIVGDAFKPANVGDTYDFEDPKEGWIVRLPASFIASAGVPDDGANMGGSSSNGGDGGTSTNGDNGSSGGGSNTSTPAPTGCGAAAMASLTMILLGLGGFKVNRRYSPQ